ncbi:MAG: transposase [Armatimonadetes bacterium]|nr:transposase [Armatimonadota bacterium]
MKRHPLAKSIAGAGWGSFLSVLKSKAERAVRPMVAADPRSTSQVCSGCGERAPKPLPVRWRSCPYCEVEVHRDINAALNSHKKGEGITFGEPLAVASG